MSIPCCNTGGSVELLKPQFSNPFCDLLRPKFHYNFLVCDEISDEIKYVIGLWNEIHCSVTFKQT
jgi:hypothetical protein